MTPEQLKKVWPGIEKSLLPGDIVFSHARKKTDWIGRGIELTTGSYWSHVSIVFANHDMLPMGGTLVIESTPISGTMIHNFRKYSSRLEDFDLGVMRYPKLSREERIHRLRRSLVDAIDAPYNYVSMLFSLVPLPVRKILQPAFSHKAREDNYICGSLVHRILHLNDKDHFERDDIRNYTAGDLSKNTEFEWIFNPHL